jgi:Co/Zn/Cd efflux system component
LRVRVRTDDDHAHERHDMHEHGDHGHAHDHDHGHQHADSPEQEHGTHDQPGHEHTGEHAPGHEHGRFAWLAHLLQPHSHDAADAVDSALTGSADGIRAVKISLVALAITAALQLSVAVASGSVAVLADTIHNFADASTAIPLWLAFWVGRKQPTARYTYGYGRAEDSRASSSWR